MMTSKRIKTFTDRYPLVGPLFWIVSVQYFVAQLIAAAAWRTPFSLRFNTISDLGNTACGVYGSRYVCSPLHVLMNSSFIMLGITMIAGSVLIYHEFRRSRASAIGFGLMALAGFGSILVGIFAENTISSLHVLGAALPFAGGNIALLVLGLALYLPRSFKLYTLASGTTGLLAFVLFGLHMYVGLGEGGMERLVAYPQTIWLILFGLYMSRNH